MVRWSRPQCKIACVLLWIWWIGAVQDITYTNYNRRLIGSSNGYRSGYSVAKAGDVNGDGIGDVIVGSYYADPSSRTDAGVSYVVFGSRTYAPLSDVDFGTMVDGTNTGFQIFGANPGDYSGYSVSGAGDFNNDGYDDVIVGAYGADPNTKSNAGAAYIIFGSANPISVDLLNMVSGATTGIRVLGAAIDDNCGWSVSAGGDINGDNRDDVLIGAPLADPGGRSAAGTVYVLWGRNANAAFVDIYLASMSSGTAVGYRLNGWTAGDQTGFSVSAAGDFNNDNYDDMILSGHLGSSLKGGAFIIYGRANGAGWSDFEISSVGGGNSFGLYMVGAANGEKAGWAVSAAGDINHDGFADVIIGAPYGDPSARSANSDAGITYVVFGKSAYGNTPLPASSGGFRIIGATAGDNSGYSVGSVGDFNADGYDDIIIGAPGYGSSAGASYVIFGHSNSLAFPDLDLLSLGDGTRIACTVANSFSGWSVTGAGDVNGDGGSDIIVGAYSAAVTGKGNPGASYIYHGIASPTSQPSRQPSSQPSRQPSRQPSSQPTSQPAADPTGQPSRQPTMQPSSQPAAVPTSQPSRQPSSQPTRQPNGAPSAVPSSQPSRQPSSQPSRQPSSVPTRQPSRQPSSQPSAQPSGAPTRQPSSQPSMQPSGQPVAAPTSQPSRQPSSRPTCQPSSAPSRQPSAQPSIRPSGQPSAQPSMQPSSQPAAAPTSQPSTQPSARPSMQPSAQPSRQPTAQPSSHPSGQPSAQPSMQPSQQPSSRPTAQPSRQPSAVPSAQPSRQPTMQPSSQPSVRPTAQPSRRPSSQPSQQPSAKPSGQPSSQPSSAPSAQPSMQPSRQPSAQPSAHPSRQPSSQPSNQPTRQPSSTPTAQPSRQPSTVPSVQPSQQPSRQPTLQPSAQPSRQPSAQPSTQPSQQPSSRPTAQPSRQPSAIPSVQPSAQPSGQPSSQPSARPTAQPSRQPSSQPSQQPSAKPSGQPSSQPSSAPSAQPSVQPSRQPSAQPSAHPSRQPSSQPSVQPTGQPSARPSSQPSHQPSTQPTSRPSSQPSLRPSSLPSAQPSSQPSVAPSAQPSSLPTMQPSIQPSSQPSGQPTALPSVQPSSQPTGRPSCQPSTQPTEQPSTQPTTLPSKQPSAQPTLQPSVQPSSLPSAQPSAAPSSQPSAQPSAQPTGEPTSQPSAAPTAQPSTQPSSVPSAQPSAVPSSQPTRAPTAQPSTQPSSRPSTQPSSQPSTQPSLQPLAVPTSQPSRQPLAAPTSQPSMQPTVLPTAQPSRRPSNQPSSQPSARPSTQPSSQPTHSPTLYIGEWTVPQTQTTLDTALIVQSAVWGCGSDNTSYTQSVCSVSDARTGELVVKYKFPWDDVVWAGDGVQSRVVLTGRIYSSGSSGSGTTSVTSEIANCAALYGQMSCTIQSYRNVDIRDASMNANTKTVVNVGRAGTAATILLYNTTSGSTSSYTYKSASAGVTSLTLLKVESLTDFFGSFVCGTSVSNMYQNGILSGWVRADTGGAVLMHIYPTSGNIRNSTELVTALAMEPTGSDSFIGGGMDVGAGVGGYVVRTSALYQKIVYAVRYVVSTSGGSRRMLSTGSSVVSVVRGIVVMDEVLYTILDSTTVIIGTNTNTTHLTILKSNINTGSIVRQAHITASNGSLLCTDIATAGNFMSIACTVRTSNATTVHSMMLTVDKDLSLRRLPAGFNKHYNASYTTLPLSLRLTPATVKVASTILPNSTYNYGLNSVPPTLAPTISPTTLVTHRPTLRPSRQPTRVPSAQPTSTPTASPSVSPQPTSQPSTSGPTNTYRPTLLPTIQLTRKPSVYPTHNPTTQPTLTLTAQPTTRPTALPSVRGTIAPTSLSTARTITPTDTPTLSPAALPTALPSALPTALPTLAASAEALNSNKRNNSAQNVALGASVAGAVVVLAVFAYVVYNRRKNKVQGGDATSPKFSADSGSADRGLYNGIASVPTSLLPLHTTHTIHTTHTTHTTYITHTTQTTYNVPENTCIAEAVLVRTASTNSLNTSHGTISRICSANSLTGSFSTSSGNGSTDSTNSGFVCSVRGGADYGSNAVDGVVGGGEWEGAADEEVEVEVEAAPSGRLTSSADGTFLQSAPVHVNVALRDTLPLAQVPLLPLTAGVLTQYGAHLPTYGAYTRTNSTYSSGDSSSYCTSSDNESSCASPHNSHDSTTGADHTSAPGLSSQCANAQSPLSINATNSNTSGIRISVPSVRRVHSKRAAEAPKYDPSTGRKISAIRSTSRVRARSPRGAHTNIGTNNTRYGTALSGASVIATDTTGVTAKRTARKAAAGKSKMSAREAGRVRDKKSVCRTAVAEPAHVAPVSHTTETQTVSGVTVVPSARLSQAAIHSTPTVQPARNYRQHRRTPSAPPILPASAYTQEPTNPLPRGLARLAS